MTMPDPHAFVRHAGALRAMLDSLAGGVDTGGLELLRLVRMVARLYDEIAGADLEPEELSGPRWRILLRLLGEEAHGGNEGASPTHLSRCQNVSKNTISVLVRGLEEQGLVERTLDPEDRRSFRIRLTPAGRALVRETAPRHLSRLNQLADGLSTEERTALIGLLEKLQQSLYAHWRS